MLFSHDTLEGTCQVSPEVSKTGKKKRRVCVLKNRTST
jgi:hypothetical protein